MTTKPPWTTLHTKTSVGRNTHGRVTVREVDTMPCPVGGLHVLATNAAGRTACEKCAVSWAELDEAARAGVEVSAAPKGKGMHPCPKCNVVRSAHNSAVLCRSCNGGRKGGAT